MKEKVMFYTQPKVWKEGRKEVDKERGPEKERPSRKSPER